MFRFTIRDVLWLMVVVAVCCGWLTSHRATVDAERELKERSEGWAKLISDNPPSPGLKGPAFRVQIVPIGESDPETTPKPQ